MIGATRRQFVSGGVVCLGYALLLPRPASALSLKGLVHSVGNIASTIVHGATTIAHDVKAVVHEAGEIAKQVEKDVLPLVNSGVKLIGEVVQEAGGVAGSALTLMNTIEGAAGTIAGEVGTLATEGLSQAFMLHVNSGFDNVPISYDVTQAAVPMGISASDLNGNPYKFVSDNADSLAAHVAANPHQTIPYSALVPGRSYRTGRVAAEAPNGAGYYPSVISIADIAKLVGLFLA